MKRIQIAVIALLLAVPGFAGMTYEFRSVTEGGQGGTIRGQVAVEGANMRIEFVEGDGQLFRDGSVVISKDGGTTLLLLDPKKKEYFEFNLEQLMSAASEMMKAAGGMMKMSIDNQKVDVKRLGDGGTIEGYPTVRYQIESEYDMNISVMGMKTSTATKMSSEVWATDKIGREYVTFIQNKNLRTGIEDLDKLIAKQADAIKGFPLKQVVKQTTTSRGRSQTSTTTTQVTAVSEATVPASKFEVPAGYKQIETPQMMAPR